LQEPVYERFSWNSMILLRFGTSLFLRTPAR
jgi:hypothetical protein